MNSLWDILSVAIGVSFVFMILSILNSWVQDYISTVFNLRASNLADVLQNLLEPQAERLNGIEKAITPFEHEGPKQEDPWKWLKKAFNYRGQLSGLLRKYPFWRSSSENNRKSESPSVVEAPAKPPADPANPLDGSGEPAKTKHLKIGQLEDAAGETVLDQLTKNPVRTLYMHPVVYSLSRPNELPDHLPTSDFTVALLDLLDYAGCKTRESTSAQIAMENIEEGIRKLECEKNSALGYRLRSLLYSAQINAKGQPDTDIAGFRNAVSDWFDDTIARGAVWYKRRMQRIGILCGIILAILLNADTVELSNALWHNAMLRESISQVASVSVSQGQIPNSDKAKENLDELVRLGLPIGWSFDTQPGDPGSFPVTTGGWATKSIGLLLTGFAISQGSQLWFDLMNRLLNIRSSAPKDSEENHSPDKKGK